MYAYPGVYNDVFMYVTGKNMLWDVEGIKRTKKALQSFDALLKRLDLIFSQLHEPFIVDWYEKPYIMEQFYVYILDLENELKYRAHTR